MSAMSTFLRDLVHMLCTSRRMLSMVLLSASCMAVISTPAQAVTTKWKLKCESTDFRTSVVPFAGNRLSFDMTVAKNSAGRFVVTATRTDRRGYLGLLIATASSPDRAPWHGGTKYTQPFVVKSGKFPAGTERPYIAVSAGGQVESNCGRSGALNWEYSKKP